MSTKTKIEPEVGQTWRNKRNGTLVTVTGRVNHNITQRGDWDYSVQHVSERGHEGQTFYPNFHGRFEPVIDNPGVPSVYLGVTEEQIVERLGSLSSAAVRRIVDAGEAVIDGRMTDGVFE